MKHVAYYPDEGLYYISDDDLIFDFIKGKSLKMLLFIGKARWPNATFIFHYGFPFYY